MARNTHADYAKSLEVWCQKYWAARNRWCPHKQRALNAWCWLGDVNTDPIFKMLKRVWTRGCNRRLKTLLDVIGLLRAGPIDAASEKCWLLAWMNLGRRPNTNWGVWKSSYN